MSTKETQQQITKHLSSEPALANTDLAAHVSDNSVVLTGSVATEEQHDLALRIAQSYAGDRKIVDRIKLRQQT
jgi:osmotically-inducible protein OsmY